MNVAPGESPKHRFIFIGLIEALIRNREVRGVYRLHADEYPLAARCPNEVDELFVAQQVGADLRYPIHLCTGGDNIPQQRLRAFDVDGEIVIDEEDRYLATLVTAPGFQSQQFVDDTLV